jgi:hypothetical protein
MFAVRAESTPSWKYGKDLLGQGPIRGGTLEIQHCASRWQGTVMISGSAELQRRRDDLGSEIT